MGRPRPHIPDRTYYISIHAVDEREPFATDEVCNYFLQHLGRVQQRTQTRIHAFCLLKTSAHLAVHVHSEPLSKFVQQLVGHFAHYLNRRWGTHGQRFAGRYQRVEIAPGEPLLEVVRHLHSNVLRAENIEPCTYPWSSHQAYLGRVPCPHWLHVTEVLETFKQVCPERSSYERFVAQDGRASFTELMRRLHWPAGHKNSPEKKAQDIARVEQIVAAVAQSVGLPQEQIVSASRRRNLARARAMIAFYATREGIPLVTAAEQLGQRNPSTICVGIARYKDQFHPSLEEMVAQSRAALASTALVAPVYCQTENT